MRKDGLSPEPQLCIQGYYVDFAFADDKVAVEADGAEFHSGDRRERDRKRDWIIGRAGWTVKRFYGTTIHHKAANCAYVIKQEVEGRRVQAKARARQEEIERQERRDALLRPFRKVIKFLMRNRKSEGKNEGA
jgi:very-short-patch-repair endonuclease